jgi:hypothetical protein
MSMPGAVESSKHYESRGAFQKDQPKMAASGWSVQAVQTVKGVDSLMQRTFHRHAPDELNVRYMRPAWPTT